MLRRDLMAAGSGLAVSTLAAPAMAQPAAQRVIRYSPHANLPNIDPFTNTAFVARDHAFLVFDQLYGMNERFEPQPQMVASLRPGEGRTFMKADMISLQSVKEVGVGVRWGWVGLRLGWRLGFVV